MHRVHGAQFFPVNGYPRIFIQRCLLFEDRFSTLIFNPVLFSSFIFDEFLKFFFIIQRQENSPFIELYTLFYIYVPFYGKSSSMLHSDGNLILIHHIFCED